jgi:acetyl-CoA synthetase
VTLRMGFTASNQLGDRLRAHVSSFIGAIAKPDDIRFAEALPKTRSGKIMRRLLKEVASGGTVIGDITTLEDFTVIAKLREAEE